MQTKTLSSAGGGLFWTMTAIACGLIAGGIYGYVISFFTEGTPSSGIMVGGLVFVVTSWLIGRFAMGRALPPPNSLPVPTAPPGGRYTIPGGAPSRPRPASQPRDAHDMGVSVGETLASARTRITEAVSTAGVVAGDVVHRVSDKVSGLTGHDGDERSSEPSEARPATAETPQPVVDAAAEPEGGGYEPAYPVGAQEGTDEPAARPAPDMGVERHEPPRFASPRDGGADDLTRIGGIGPELEQELNGLGIFHYAQIASWTPAETAWIDGNLGASRGQAARDGWVEQAARLVAGDASHTPGGAGEY